MSKVKAVIFDCFGVLIGDVLRVKANELSMTHPEAAEQIYGTLRAGDRGIITPEEVIDHVADALGISREEVLAMTAEGERRNEPLINQIIRLRATYKTGLLSNVASKESVQRRFDRKLDTYFDAVVVSAEVGAIKPEPEIYYVAAERLKVKPEECVFIDDIGRNVEGARAVGMQGIVYENNAQVLTALEQLLGQPVS